MAETLDRAPSAAMSTLPGAAVLLRLRRLLISALLITIAYNLVARASRSMCSGGFDGAGGYVDGNGRATAETPECVQLTLEPSFVVFLAIAVTIIAAVTRVLKRAGDTRTANRILARATILISAIAAVSTVISYVWFFLIPIESAFTGGTIWYPFPFGSVVFDADPMPN